MIHETNWEERYKTSTTTLPWDTGTPAPELIEAFSELNMAGHPTLEIGCGTGTNAVWMAQQGCAVTATDISPTAIEAAKKKASAVSVKVDFETSDIGENCPVTEGSVDFVFDRGVFHVMPENKRDVFTKRVAEALSSDGYWLCVAGSKDEVRESTDQGPPQLSAAEIINGTEKHFEIHRVKRSYFTLPNGTKHLAWEILMKKRLQSAG